jgi:hypothetical protein
MSVNFTPPTISYRKVKNFLSNSFSIRRRGTPVIGFAYEYRQFLKNFERALLADSGAWGKLISFKNLKLKNLVSNFI